MGAMVGAPAISDLAIVLLVNETDRLFMASPLTSARCDLCTNCSTDRRDADSLFKGRNVTGCQLAANELLFVKKARCDVHPKFRRLPTHRSTGAIKVTAPASVKGYSAPDGSRLIEVYFGINTVSMM